MYFTEGIIYEIAKYLSGNDYLTIRFVFRVPYEHIYDDTPSGAIWLIKKGFQTNSVVIEHSNNPEVAMHNAWLAYKYARDVINGAWPPGEDVIKTDEHYSYWYALEVINGPWPSGEPVIAINSCCAYYYAKNIIKNRWPPGEAAIRSNKYDSISYDNFIDTCFQN
jgi:hypothetical protein